MLSTSWPGFNSQPEKYPPPLPSKNTKDKSVSLIQLFVYLFIYLFWSPLVYMWLVGTFVLLSCIVRDKELSILKVGETEVLSRFKYNPHQGKDIWPTEIFWVGIPQREVRNAKVLVLEKFEGQGKKTQNIANRFLILALFVNYCPWNQQTKSGLFLFMPYNLLLRFCPLLVCSFSYLRSTKV